MHTQKNTASYSLFQRPILLSALLVFTAFSIRSVAFGTPFFSTDEQFYLVAGGRLLLGDLPFVDVWDRKPIGIFLLYAFFHIFGPWRFFAYQIGATISVSLTAIIIMRAARIIAPPQGAFLSALLYIGWCNISHGGGGQTPVFYNLLIAYALYITMRAAKSSNKERLNITAMKVMALFGVALQIKYTVVFEGIFAGIYFLYENYIEKRSLCELLKKSINWLSIALLPSIIIFLFYTSIGEWHNWWFSNFQSIFFRGNFTVLSAKIYMGVISLFLFIPFTFYFSHKRYHKKTNSIPLLWAFSSWLGVFLVGGYFTHYMLPLFVPFFVIFAPLWSSKAGKVYLIMAAVIGIIWGTRTVYHSSHKEKPALLSDVQHIIAKKPGCLFVYDGPSSFEDVAPYCHLTPYLFPGHLNEQREKNTLGVNQLNELKRVLSQRPLYIMDNVPHDFSMDVDKSIDDTLHEVLREDYHVVYDPNPHKKSNRIILYMQNTPSAVTP